MRKGAADAEFADGYGYDARVLPRKNALLTSSFTGWNNYTMDFGKLTADPEAMKHFGSTMVMWDFHTRQPKKVFQVPGVPLEIRWAWGEKHNYAFTATALTSKIWLVYADDKGEWQAAEVAPISEVKGRRSAGRHQPERRRQNALCRFFRRRQMPCLRRVGSAQAEADLRETDRQAGQHGLAKLGRETALFHQLALIASWDKKGDDNEQFVRAYGWDGKELKPTFDLDFTALKLGRPHHMLFGSTKIGAARTTIASAD